MPNDLGISFSPFSQQNGQQGQQQGPPGGRPSTPQDAIRILSFRPPRTVGAASPIPGGLLNAPGGAGFGGQFGPAGGNLEQLLALLFGPNRNMPGGGSFNERPAQGDLGMGGMFGGGQPSQGAFGGGQTSQPLPWEQPWTPPETPPTKAPAPWIRPGQDEPRDNNQSLPGGTAGPGPFAGPSMDRPGRGDRFA